MAKMIRIMGYAGDEKKIVRYAKKYSKMAVAELDQLLRNNGMLYMLGMSKDSKVGALVGTMIAAKLSNKELWDRVSGKVSPVWVDVAV